MQYLEDLESAEKIKEIISTLELRHIDPERVKILRSRGSKSRRTLARIHTVPKIMQKALEIQAHYVIELITENYNRLSHEDQEKTLIHELMHIPHTFGGGFRHHKPFVTRRTVDMMYKQYKNQNKNKNQAADPSISVFMKIKKLSRF